MKTKIATWKKIWAIGLIFFTCSFLYYSCERETIKRGQVWEYKSSNPFDTNYNFCLVLRVKDGFVKFKYLNNNQISSESKNLFVWHSEVIDTLTNKDFLNKK
jgi:hypothetical protein